MLESFFFASTPVLLQPPMLKYEPQSPYLYSSEVLEENGLFLSEILDDMISDIRFFANVAPKSDINIGSGQPPSLHCPLRLYTKNNANLYPITRQKKVRER